MVQGLNDTWHLQRQLDISRAASMKGLRVLDLMYQDNTLAEDTSPKQMPTTCSNDLNNPHCISKSYISRLVLFMQASNSLKREMNTRQNNNEAAFANLAQKMVEPRDSHGLSFGLLLITPFLDCLLVRFVICGVLISLLLPRVQGEDATSNVHLFPGNGSVCGHKDSIKYYQVIHILLGHFVSSYRQVYDIYPYGASMHFC